MKAAVIHRRGGVPVYEDFPDPVPADGQVLIDVRAVAVENVDRAVAAGEHYTSTDPVYPLIPCFDGVGTLPDGTLVGFGNVRAPYGALAEKVAVDAYAPIPEGVEATLAPALATAFTGMAMRTAAGFQPGETVLVQGATGVAGRVALQIARLLGAGRVVATGRDDEALASSGADAVINTAVSDEDLRRAFVEAGPYDVVLDYLWGRPAEVLFRALTPESFAFAKPTRVVQIGESAGNAVTLRADSLRTSGVEVYGAAKGLSGAGMGEVYEQILAWTRSGELVFEREVVPLSDIESAWQRTDLRGKRLIVTP
ncbi:quinone oxidoreductase family protein [Cryptosporangium phraense]|uniref:Zinc-binding alcohol dehydrogenase family protein n=1 Tax=Cryptosporangium phraense TaxID=2593070 RepID=A0A545AMY3_9ACTN|nr:zinc-binding alcohol dehydrogenase family protein [Cryptosporangium phraense]TQS42682.1 zinc-binding alcohol dehydrogenase family protein [Cryptosporangium phraense]